MLYHAGVPKEFWAEALNAAVCLRNCSPTTSLNKVFIESIRGVLWSKTKHLESNSFWMHSIHAHIPDAKRDKLSEN